MKLEDLFYFIFFLLTLVSAVRFNNSDVFRALVLETERT